MNSFILHLFGLVLLQRCAMGQKYNILLIVADDLRPALGCYNDKNSFTPNIDKFARESIIFSNTFVQQAVCAPSRNSFLTSRRPDTLRLYDFYNYWRTFAGNYTTLPQYFKENKYYTKSIGKVFHPGVSSNFSDDQPYSWSDDPFHPRTEIYKNERVCVDKHSLKTLHKNIVCPVIPGLQPGNTLPDIESTNEAVSELKKLKKEGKPFFLALGFHKPHIPLKYPVQYKRYHPLENVTIPDTRFRPISLPLVAWNPWTDLRDREDIQRLNISFPFGSIPDYYVKEITQSYYASVTYVDDLIGRVISELKSTDQYKNTIIALIGDHGWSLGEHGEWSKFSNFEVAVRVPFVLRVPGLTDSKSKNSKKFKTVKELVELVDLFPTLADLAGLPLVRQCPEKSERIDLCTEGLTLRPLIESSLYGMNKLKKPFKEWKSGVFSQYPRPGAFPTLHPNSDKPKLKEIKIMGYSLRTQRYRYTEWVTFSNFTPNWNETYGIELYDHYLDPQEMNNLSNRQPLYEVKQALSEQLRQGWMGSLPQFI